MLPELLLCIVEMQQDSLTSNRIEYIRPNVSDWYLPMGNLSKYDNLFNEWAKYLESPKEDTNAYEALKKKLLAAMGEKSFADLLACTTYLHRTTYLQAKGIKEIAQECARV